MQLRGILIFNMLKLRHKQAGFTIIEVLVVIVILAILAAITFVSYAGIQDRAEATKAAALAKQYADIFEVYRSEKWVYPGRPGDTVCLGPPDSFPASSRFDPGECFRFEEEGHSDWWSSVSVDNDFNASVESYGAVIKSDLKPLTVSEDFHFPWDEWTEHTSYRGIIYHKQHSGWSSSSNNTNAYITYFIKRGMDCPNGEGQEHNGVTECKISLEGGAATPGYDPWGKNGGGERN